MDLGCRSGIWIWGCRSGGVYRSGGADNLLPEATTPAACCAVASTAGTPPPTPRPAPAATPPRPPAAPRRSAFAPAASPASLTPRRAAARTRATRRQPPGGPRVPPASMTPAPRQRARARQASPALTAARHTTATAPATSTLHRYVWGAGGVGGRVAGSDWQEGQSSASTPSSRWEQLARGAKGQSSASTPPSRGASADPLSARAGPPTLRRPPSGGKGPPRPPPSSRLVFVARCTWCAEVDGQGASGGRVWDSVANFPRAVVSLMKYCGRAA